MQILEEMALPLAISLVFYASSNFLSYAVVREHVRIHWSLVILFTVVETILQVLLRSLHWLLNIPLVYLCLYVYTKVVNVQPAKLLYLSLIIVSVQVICNDIVYLITGSAYTWTWDDMRLVLVVFSVMTAATYVLLRRVVWPMLRRMNLSKIPWLWLIPITFITINLLLSSSHIQALLSPEMHLPYNILMPFLALATGLTSLLMLKILAQTSDRLVYEANLQQMDMMLSTEARRFQELTQTMHEVRMLRHDMRHHLTAMKMMLDEGNFDELSDYMNAYYLETEKQESIQFSPNFIGDLIARLTQLRGQAAGVEVDIVCALPANFWISNTDLCILLGNITENAMHACILQTGGRRHMKARARVDGNFAFITLENTYEEGSDTPEARERAGLRQSAGYGIPSVEAIVRKYHGEVQLEGRNGIFYTSIMLCAPAHIEMEDDVA